MADAFAVPEDWTLEEILDHAKDEIHWAETSGPYAAPEIWFQHIPALVSLLKATTERIKNNV